MSLLASHPLIPAIGVGKTPKRTQVLREILSPGVQAGSQCKQCKGLLLTDIGAGVYCGLCGRTGISTNIDARDAMFVCGRLWLMRAGPDVSFS